MLRGKNVERATRVWWDGDVSRRNWLSSNGSEFVPICLIAWAASSARTGDSCAPSSAESSQRRNHSESDRPLYRGSASGRINQIRESIIATQQSAAALVIRLRGLTGTRDLWAKSIMNVGASRPI